MLAFWHQHSLQKWKHAWSMNILLTSLSWLVRVTNPFAAGNVTIGMQACAGTVILMLFWDCQGTLVQNYMCKRATVRSALAVTSLEIIWEQPPAENFMDCSVPLSCCSVTDSKLHTVHVTTETKTFILSVSLILHTYLTSLIVATLCSGQLRRFLVEGVYDWMWKCMVQCVSGNASVKSTFLMTNPSIGELLRTLNMV